MFLFADKMMAFMSTLFTRRISTIKVLLGRFDCKFTNLACRKYSIIQYCVLKLKLNKMVKYLKITQGSIYLQTKSASLFALFFNSSQLFREFLFL